LFTHPLDQAANTRAVKQNPAPRTGVPKTRTKTALNLCATYASGKMQAGAFWVMGTKMESQLNTLPCHVRHDVARPCDEGLYICDSSMGYHMEADPPQPLVSHKHAHTGIKSKHALTNPSPNRRPAKQQYTTKLDTAKSIKTIPCPLCWPPRPINTTKATPTHNS
jgi:hypothetical protein